VLRLGCDAGQFNGELVDHLWPERVRALD